MALKVELALLSKTFLTAISFQGLGSLPVLFNVSRPAKCYLVNGPNFRSWVYYPFNVGKVLNTRMLGVSLRRPQTGQSR